MIVEVLDCCPQKGRNEDSLTEAAVRDKVKALIFTFSDLPIARRGGFLCVPELRKSRHPGEGFAADRGFPP